VATGPFAVLGGPKLRPQKGCVVQTFPGPYTIGMTTFTPPELSDSLSATEMAALGAQWFMNYLCSSTIQTTIPFVPMIFSPAYLTPQNLRQAAIQRTILGYNEPDNGPPQANTTVAQALIDWAQFEAAASAVPGCRLGSPVVANNTSNAPGDWLYDFINGTVPATGLPPHVDFIPLHFYTDKFTDPAGAATDLKNLIIRTHASFQKPCWVTELGATKFAGDVTLQEYPDTTAKTSAIIQAFIPQALEDNLFVERIAWYPNVVPAGFPPGAAGNVLNVELADLTGALSAPGTTYRDTGNQ